MTDVGLLNDSKWTVFKTKITRNSWVCMVHVCVSVYMWYACVWCVCICGVLVYGICVCLCIFVWYMSLWGVCLVCVCFMDVYVCVGCLCVCVCEVYVCHVFSF